MMKYLWVFLFVGIVTLSVALSMPGQDRKSKLSVAKMERIMNEIKQADEDKAALAAEEGDGKNPDARLQHILAQLQEKEDEDGGALISGDEDGRKKAKSQYYYLHHYYKYHLHVCITSYSHHHPLTRCFWTYY